MPESRFANGNIYPSCFVSLDNTSPAVGRVVTASAGGKCFGIAQPSTRNAPYTGLDDGYAAIAGETVMVYTFADKEVYLQIGAGGCAAGDRLKATTNGVGIVTTTNLDEYGAVAKQSGNSGDLVPVDVYPMSQISAT